MSVGSNLQEMENAVTKERLLLLSSMPKLDLDTPGQPSVEDLGGPSPENYRPDDDSAKLKTPSLAQVKDVVNKGAKPAEAMPAGMKEESEEVEEDQEIVSEEETTEEEVVSEEETTEEEVVAELPTKPRKKFKKPLKQNLALKKTLMLSSLVKNFPRSSRTRHAQSLKPQSSLRLRK